MMTNKLKMYINDSIPRFETEPDAASWIQKSTKA